MLVRAVRLFTSSKFDDGLTNRHSLSVEFVEESTIFSKSTDSFQPVSADSLQDQHKMECPNHTILLEILTRNLEGLPSRTAMKGGRRLYLVFQHDLLFCKMHVLDHDNSLQLLRLLHYLYSAMLSVVVKDKAPSTFGMKSKSIC